MSGTVSDFFTGAMVTYTITVTGTYQLTAIGAQGGAFSSAAPGGLGADVTADYQLTAGTVLSIAVGGNGISTPDGDGGGAGGGGGTLVTLGAPASSQSTVLVVAGGGGGGGSAEVAGLDGAGNAPIPPFAVGGVVGQGADGHGSQAGRGGTLESGGGASLGGAGGAGVKQAGQIVPGSASIKVTGGSTYPSLSGGTIGGAGSGGFGGGGAADFGAGGGGGGYSGGGGGGMFPGPDSDYRGSGGGGGSFADAALATSVTYDLDPIGANADGAFAPLPAQFDITLLSPACFTRGTALRTDNGARRVEDLAVGDRLALHEGDAGRIVWIGHRRIDCAAHPAPATVWPVRVRAGTFGPGLPATDLVLSPDHALFLESALIPVRLLADGDAIAQEPWDTVEYWHVELESHDIVLAHGLPVESFLDVGTRTNLTGDDAAPLRLHPDFGLPGDAVAQMWEAHGRAPLVLAGPALARARDRLSKPPVLAFAA